MAREMKHSGIEWIGEIPKEWKVMPFKQMYELGKGLSITKADLVEEGIPVISYGQIHSKGNTGTTIKDELIRYVPDEFLDGNASSLVKKGDIIFADTSEDLDGCGNCVYIDRDITIFAGYHTIIAKYLSSKPNNYLSYLFKTDCWRSQIRSGVNGVKLFSVPQRLLGSTTIILPPISEQQKIANYLDRVCGEVDEMIALQEQMIEELKAYKQSVITEAVTKGLNPNVPMKDSASREQNHACMNYAEAQPVFERKFKDSGIDWIGEVPEHWEIERLKFLCSIQTGNQDTQDARQDGEYPFYVRSPKVEHSSKCSFEGEGILMAGDGAGAGRVFHHAFGKYAVHQRVYRLSEFSNKIDTNYLFHYISSLFCKVMDMGSAQSTVPSVRLPMLLNFVVCTPHLSEQQSIASYLDTKCTEIDALIAIKQAKIEELKDYKKSVIYEYVTGEKEVV